MRAPLTLAVAQPPCVPADVAANAVTHAAMVRSAGARVVVFPELSLSGYELAAPSIVADDPRLAPIVQACRDEKAIALAGAPVRGQDGRDYIATLAIDGTAVTVAYRKMWLHPPEPDRFAPGDKPAVVEVDGWRLGLAICRDSGVPEHALATASLGIDAYLASTLFSFGARNRRDARMRAIAAEHRVWVAVASFAGPTGGYRTTSGGSGIWAPDGSLAAQAGLQAGTFVLATLI
ncbi:carbon-nitrogen hydrolase family protein [Nonomuraea sp. NBC_00507]